MSVSEWTTNAYTYVLIMDYILNVIISKWFTRNVPFFCKFLVIFFRSALLLLNYVQCHVKSKIFNGEYKKVRHCMTRKKGPADNKIRFTAMEFH